MVEDIHGNPIERLWVAEFCGLFAADGTIGIRRYSRMRNGKRDIGYFAQAVIQLRADNLPVLLDIHEKLGGRVNHTCGTNHFVNPQGVKYLRNPQRAWNAERISDVQRLLRVLRTSRMPHQKWKVLDLVEEFLAIPRVRGKHIDDAMKDRMARMHEESKRLHLYLPTA